MTVLNPIVYRGVRYPREVKNSMWCETTGQPKRRYEYDTQLTCGRKPTGANLISTVWRHNRKHNELEYWQLTYQFPAWQSPAWSSGAVPTTATTNPRHSNQQTYGVTENKPSLWNPQVVISRPRPFTDNVVPKLVAIATSLRHAISVMSSSDSLTSKIYPYRISESLAVIQPKFYIDSRFTCPTPYPKRPTNLRGGWRPQPCLVWTSSPSHRLTLMF